MTTAKPKKTALDKFKKTCPELFQSTLIRFELVTFPLVVAEADIHETTLSDYSEIELLMLKLIAAGIKPMDTEILMKMTGLSRMTVERTIMNEINVNNHFDEDGNLSAAGKDTLAENISVPAGQLQNKRMFQTVRELQIDGSTGIPLRQNICQPVFQKKYSTAFKLDYEGMPDHIECLSRETLESDLRNAFAEALYQDYDSYMNDDNVINSVDAIKTFDIYHCYAYLVQFADQKYPFLAVMTETAGDIKLSHNTYVPICLPKSFAQSIQADPKKYESVDDGRFELPLDYCAYTDPVIQTDENHDIEIILKRFADRQSAAWNSIHESHPQK